MKLTGLIIIAIFLYLGDISISTSPWIVKMPSWRISVGYSLIILGMAYVINHHKRLAKREGKKEGIQFQIDSIQKEQETIRKDCERIINMNKILDDRMKVQDDRSKTLIAMGKALDYEMGLWKPKQN